MIGIVVSDDKIHLVQSAGISNIELIGIGFSSGPAMLRKNGGLFKQRNGLTACKKQGQ
jgi:hypothetical protein